MATYRGVLSNLHVRAVARLAMRAHGWVGPTADHRAHIEQQWQLGLRLRDSVLCDRIPPCLHDPAWDEVARTEPRLWQQLPFVFALGHRQTEVLAELLGAPAEEHTALLGAAFNGAIVVLDYLIDERGLQEEVFALVRPALVRSIFDPAGNWQAELTRAWASIADPRLKHFAALFGICAAEGNAAHRRHGNDGAWRELGRTVGNLLIAQHRVSVRARGRSCTTQDVVTKSTLPTLAMLHVAALSAPQVPDERALTVARALGDVFWRVDELVDILDDCRRGEPSTVVLRLGEVVSDGDLYDMIDVAAGELIAALEPACFAEVAELVEFAQHTVAAWLNILEEPAEARTKWSRPALRQPIEAALAMLLDQQRADFREATHFLRFPRVSGEYQTHPAWVSFHAVALDALLDARAAGLHVAPSVLATEALKLLRAKHRTVRGGWNYIPEVQELPPDTDDLGQITQVLQRLGGWALSLTCDEGIRLALDAAEPDGGIHTWILDPRGATPADAIVSKYLGIMGGWGVHPEVVANFLYGLILVDPMRYAEPLQRGAQYLELVQSPEGAWPSKWYAGMYYGTFRAVEVMSVVARSSPALDRARAFMRSHQRPSGGFGEGDGDPLSTALALSTLIRLDEHEAAARARDCLLRMQEADGGFPAVPWISFPTADRLETYGSRTMTTAFCLKALVRCT